MSWHFGTFLLHLAAVILTVSIIHILTHYGALCIVSKQRQFLPSFRWTSAHSVLLYNYNKNNGFTSFTIRDSQYQNCCQSSCKKKSVIPEEEPKPESQTRFRNITFMWQQELEPVMEAESLREPKPKWTHNNAGQNQNQSPSQSWKPKSEPHAEPYSWSDSNN